MIPRVTSSASPSFLYDGVQQAMIYAFSHCHFGMLVSSVFFVRGDFSPLLYLGVNIPLLVQYLCLCQFTPNMLNGMISKSREVKSLLRSNRSVYSEHPIWKPIKWGEALLSETFYVKATFPIKDSYNVSVLACRLNRSTELALFNCSISNIFFRIHCDHWFCIAENNCFVSM